MSSVLSPSKMSPSKVSKAQEILLSIFGEPLSGFTGVGYPTEREVVSYWMWLMELEVQTKKGVNRSAGHGDAVTKIANSLEVQWRFTSPDVPTVNKDCVKQKVRDVISRAKGLMNKTYNLKNEKWISDQKASFLSTVDIGTKPKVSHEVTKNILYFCSKEKARKCM